MSKKKHAHTVSVTDEEATPVAETASGERPESDGHKEKRKKKGKADASADAEALVAAQDQLVRLQADFENYRKRTNREKAELYSLANADLMTELLPVLDHFDLAFTAAQGDATDRDAIAEGIRLVRGQLLAALAKFNLEAVDAEGKSFDPNFHEAVSHIPSNDVAENGVIAQTRRGYKLGSKLLRPAEVVVSSGPVESQAATGTGED